MMTSPYRLGPLPLTGSRFLSGLCISSSVRAASRRALSILTLSASPAQRSVRVVVLRPRCVRRAASAPISNCAEDSPSFRHPPF